MGPPRPITLVLSAVSFLETETRNRTMDNTIIGVLAAIGGSSVGALTPVLSNYVLQRSVTQREIANREIAQREALFADFIKEGAELYAKAVSNDLQSLDQLISLFALVNRIRLFASEPVVQAAEQFVRQVIHNFGEANLSLSEIRNAALASKADPLEQFTLECRRELRQMFVSGRAQAVART
jgi:hypothetical protein